MKPQPETHAEACARIYRTVSQTWVPRGVFSCLVTWTLVPPSYGVWGVTGSHANTPCLSGKPTCRAMMREHEFCGFTARESFGVPLQTEKEKR